MEDADDEEDDVIDLNGIGARFFPNLDILDEQDICPSLKTFDLGDPSGTSNIPFLKAPEDWRQDKDKSEDTMPSRFDQTGMLIDEDNPAGFDDDENLLGDFDIPADADFGEGGEAWARDAAIESRPRVYNAELDGGGSGPDDEGIDAGTFDPGLGGYTIAMDKTGSRGGHDDIMSYFDEALKKNWAGPEHWRIRKIKDVSKPATVAKPRKEKEVFEVDFLSSLSVGLADTIYTQASSNSVISLPKKDWKSKSRNLLPDDKHFNSKQLLTLFLKPRARMGGRRFGFNSKAALIDRSPPEIPDGEMDEAFWANKEAPLIAGDEEPAREGDYDANFFQDDAHDMGDEMGDAGDLEFEDAREHLSPGVEDGQEHAKLDGILGGLPGTQASEGAFGTQLITQSRRVRPEYVQYARVAKKVDVRRLKEELWKGMGLEDLVCLNCVLCHLPPLYALFKKATATCRVIG